MFSLGRFGMIVFIHFRSSLVDFGSHFAGWFGVILGDFDFTAGTSSISLLVIFAVTS